jgi:hypothetical protein
VDGSREISFNRGHRPCMYFLCHFSKDAQ